MSVKDQTTFDALAAKIDIQKDEIQSLKYENAKLKEEIKLEVNASLTNLKAAIGLHKELETREAEIEVLKTQISQLICAVEVKPKNPYECRHQNASYNNQASWCYDCGTSWSVREICESVTKGLNGDKDER